jgi:hypothetical protein
VYYVVTMFNGEEILLAEKDDIAEMLRTWGLHGHLGRLLCKLHKGLFIF